MKLTRITATNYLGARAVDAVLTKRVNLFAGHNGAGKSSLRDAIALALTADLGRVSLKKEAVALITDGATEACVTIDTDSFASSVTLTATGKIVDSLKGVETVPALRFVLDAQRFARLEPTERRAFLFDLMGLSAGGDAVRARLKAKGCNEKNVERVMPMLRAGFDAACKDAKEKATQAKGAWRAVTGETYGSEKAKTWRTAAPAHDAALVADLIGRQQAVDAALEQVQQRLGSLQAEQQRRQALQAKLPGLREHAERIPRIELKLQTDEKQFDDWDADLVKTKAAAGGAPRVGIVHRLAAAVARALPAWPNQEQVSAGWTELREALTAYEDEHGPALQTGGDGKALARLPAVQQSRDLFQRAVANGKRDLDAAKAAKAEAEAISAELAEAFDAAGFAEEREKVDRLKANRAELVKQLDTQRAVQAQAAGAEQKTKDAAQHAADVAAWDVIADALSPNGIPAEMLSEALDPINDRLMKSAMDAEWPRVGVEADMSISVSVGEAVRPYALCSESEKWRCDAMLAEAIAFLSGTKLLVLDRFDVLDLQGRSDLLAWLDILASDGEIDSALVFGTLKAPPANLPETIAVHWIENGVLGQLREAA